MKKTFIIILLILNLMVFAGQVYPAGAPPFATTVNIITVALNIIFLLLIVFKKKNK